MSKFSTLSRGGSKKKLEITVVDARPMSQSGFVDLHGAQRRGDANGARLGGKLHPSQSVDDLLGEKDCLLELGPDAGARPGLPGGIRKPTIIRPSKSNDNLKSEADDPFEVPLRQPTPRGGGSRHSVADEPWGGAGACAVVNPSFRLESDKRVPAPAPPRARKKPPPPRPPPMAVPPTRREPSAAVNRSSIMSELEEIFASSKPPAPAAEDRAEPPPKPARSNSRGNVGGRPTSLVRPILTVPHGMALHDFDGSEPGDLSFRAGDTIRLTEKTDEQWYTGCNLRTQQEGLFPLAYVEVKVPLVPPPEEADRTPLRPRPQPKPRIQSPTAAAAAAPAVVKAAPSPPANRKSIWPPQPPPIAKKPIFHPPSGAIVSEPPPVARKPQWPPPTAAVAPEPPAVVRKPGQSPPTATVAPEPPAAARKPVWPPVQPAGPPSPPRQPPPALPVKPIKPGKLEKPKKPRAPSCRAVYAYQSGVEDDLAFEPGDLIHLLARESDDWLRGELRGKVGIFPQNYVEVVEDLPTPPPPPDSEPEPPAVLFKVRGVFQYDGPHGDLSFKVGDQIEVTRVLDADWMEGRLHGSSGLFPSNFVERTDQAPAKPASPPPPPPKAKARALYSFRGEAEGDLTFQEGDEIILKEEVDADWLRGEANGCVGIFPKSFVTILVPL